MIFDLNSRGMRPDLVDFDSIYSTRLANPMFNNLCNNTDFRDRFVDRLYQMGTDEFAPQRVNQIVDGYVSEIESPMENHLKRFYGTDNTIFYSEIDNLKYFFDNRPQYIDVIVKNNFPEYSDSNSYVEIE